jgi:hypothetical protein
LTLLYPLVPSESLTDANLSTLREFFASQPALAFELTRVAVSSSGGMYANSEPDDAPDR